QSLVASFPSERERNAALFFLTLGHVIHVLQDMAQPQHTRNDPHSGCVPAIGGHKSVYEAYIEKRALNDKFRTRREPSPALKLEGYLPPSLPSYEAYWSGVKGLADFSSRNFFTAGTNLDLESGCSGLLAPPCQLSAYEPQNRSFEFVFKGGKTSKGTVQLFTRAVVDPVTGEAQVAAVPSRSVWDEHLEKLGHFPIFTQNTLTYDSISDLLIPRAVGYSAGFLNRFFRASIGAQFDLVRGIRIFN